MNKNQTQKQPDYYLHTIDIYKQRIHEFKITNEEIYILSQDLYICSRWLVEAYLESDFGHFIESHLIQKIQDFFHNSILQCMMEKPQLGLASARIALESGRDLLRILESQDNRNLYLEINPTKNQIKAYREIFRFSESDNEKVLLSFYNFSSNYGIHSKYQTGDPVGEIQSSINKNYKVTRQRQLSLEAIKIILVSNLMTLDALKEKSLEVLSKDESALMFLRLFIDKQKEVLPKVMDFREFLVLSS